MTKRIITPGDSKTAENQTPGFFTFAQSWPGQMQANLIATGRSVVVINPAISGSSAGTDGHSPWDSPTTADLTPGYFAGIDANGSVLYEEDGYIAFLALGHNDLAFGGSASFVLDRLEAFSRELVRRQYKVILTTLLPSGVILGAAETARQTINSTILAGTLGYEAVDFNTIPEAALINDTTWYLDTTHPTAALLQKMGKTASDGAIALGVV